MEHKKRPQMILYFHAGSGNHGCEAIVRSTVRLLGERPVLISDDPAGDLQYGIADIAGVKAVAPAAYTVLDKVRIKLSGSDRLAYEIRASHEVSSFEAGSVALSVGGDNYCYGDSYNWHLAGLNQGLHRRGIKTVLWGCSIDPESVTDDMKKDFSCYDLIVARESISYSFLKEINPNTIYACDPAFTLEKEELPLPEGFVPGQTVGINISPLIQKHEREAGITFANYRNLMQYILDRTDYHIALIPHVVQTGNDDREPLKRLYAEFPDQNRICMIDDGNCKQLKGFIARCILFIGARTHATIAAYSSCVPTLVIGYSTKAKGIAKDLFGTEENFVLPVQSLENPMQMCEAFYWLNDNLTSIRSCLERKIPAYKQTVYEAAERVKGL